MTFQRTYNFHDIPVGESVDMPLTDPGDERRIRRAVVNYNERTEKHFSCRKKDGTIKIVRNR